MIDRLVILLIRGYQYLLSPLLGGCCRFSPSCSQYCLDAVRLHGGARGVGLGLRRLLKCHPWHPGGVDEVPAAVQRHGSEVDLARGSPS